MKRSRFLSIFDPAGKKLKIRVLLGMITGLVLSAAGICLGLMNLYFGTGRYKMALMRFYFRKPDLVVLNVLPFVLLILLLWALTNRAWISFLLDGIFTLSYSWAEYWKLMGRSDPIIAEDLTVISEGLQMAGRYISVTWQIVFSAFLVIAGTLVFFFFFRGRLPKLLPRLTIAAALIAASLLLYSNVYLDYYRYKSYGCWENLNKWIESNSFISKGCIYPFLYSTKSANSPAPEGYTDSAAEALLSQYTTDDITEDKRVNVIVVMLEAFADLSDCTDRITAADPYLNYHRLIDESYHGRLVTNIFAAGTVDTERCVLTGFSELTSFRRASWSYARYFSDQGYAVNGSHPVYQSFYNRLNVNRNLGFDRYYFFENLYDELSPGHIAPDRILLPEIVDLCREDLKTNDYVFSFNVTYQNHGPYPADSERFSHPYVPAEGLNTDSYIIVNNYLYGLEDTGRRMMDMVDSLRDDDAPWVVVFFGDHKPWLGDQNSVYIDLGIDLNSENDEGFYNYYSTEYLIWANRAAKEKLGSDFVGEGPVISPCYLMNVLFELCGWEGPSYMKLSDQVMFLLPVVSSKDCYLENGRLIAGTEMSEQARDAYRQMLWAQYYLMRDSGGALPSYTG